MEFQKWKQPRNHNSADVYNNFRYKSCVETFKKLEEEKYGFQKTQLWVMESFKMQNPNHLDKKFDLFE